MFAWGGEGMKEVACFISAGKETFTQLSSPLGACGEGRKESRKERQGSHSSSVLPMRVLNR